MYARVLSKEGSLDDAVAHLEQAVLEGFQPEPGFDNWFPELHSHPRFSSIAKASYKTEIERFFDRRGYTQLMQHLVQDYQAGRNQ